MTLLMYGSLAVAIVCIIGYVILIHFKSRAFVYRAQIKKALLFGGVIFYLVFFGLSVHTYQGHKASIQTISDETKGNIKKAMASFTTSNLNATVANSRINVKIRTSPPKFQPNKPMILQLLIANESDSEVKDLRMNFLEGDLASSFIINEIKGNSKLNIFDNIITLGTLKAGETRKIEFDLTSKNAVSYIGRIVWQAGNNYIFGEDNKPLESIISLELDEEYENPKDEAFDDFVDLKPIDELIEEPDTTDEDLIIVETDDQDLANDELDPADSENTQEQPEDTDTSVVEDVYDNDSLQEGE